MTTESASNRSVQQNDGGPQTPDEVAGWFDNNGNLLQLQASASGTDGLAWDGSNNVQSVTLVSRSSGDNDREVYQYSGSERVRKQTRTLVNSDAGLWRVDEVRYLPGLELRRRWQETADGDSSPSEELHVMVSQAGRAGIRVLHWETGKPDAISNDQVRWSVDDNIGSLALELDAEGQLISREEYYPFGGTAVWAGRSEAEASYKTIRYSGKERDGTGLYYYGHRYYAPWLCRWVSADPAGEVDGLNLFRMVRNNPSTYRDKQGLAITVGDVKYRNAAHFKRSSLYQNLLSEYSQPAIDELIAHYDSVGEYFTSERSVVRRIKKDILNYNSPQSAASVSSPASQGGTQSDDYNIIIQDDVEEVFRADARSPEEIIEAGGFGNPPSLKHAGTLGRFENGKPVEPIVYTAESKIGMTRFAGVMPGEKYYYKIDTRGLKVASYERNFENLKAQKNLLTHLKKQIDLMARAAGEGWEAKSDIELRRAIADVNNEQSWRSLTTGVQEAHVIGDPEYLLTPDEIFSGKIKSFIPLDRITLIGKVSEGVWDKARHRNLTGYSAA